MNDVFQLTMESMSCGSDEIALQGINFNLFLIRLCFNKRQSNSGQPYAMKRSTCRWRSQKRPSRNARPVTSHGLFLFLLSFKLKT